MYIVNAIILNIGKLFDGNENAISLFLTQRALLIAFCNLTNIHLPMWHSNYFTAFEKQI
jgi:hypothetical protein